MICNKFRNREVVVETIEYTRSSRIRLRLPRRFFKQTVPRNFLETFSRVCCVYSVSRPAFYCSSDLSCLPAFLSSVSDNTNVVLVDKKRKPVEIIIIYTERLLSVNQNGRHNSANIYLLDLFNCAKYFIHFAATIYFIIKS